MNINTRYISLKRKLLLTYRDKKGKGIIMNIKKLVTGLLITAVSASFIGCGTSADKKTTEKATEKATEGTTVQADASEGESGNYKG